MDIDSSLSIHHRNTQTLATEIYKVKKSSSLEIMNEIFQLKEDNHYTARQVSQFIVTAWKVSKYGAFSGPYFTVFGLHTDQNELRIWTFSWQWVLHVNNVFNGSKSVSHTGPIKIWELIPCEIKQVSSLSEFKHKFKRWKQEECPCRIWKHYTAGVS